MKHPALIILEALLSGEEVQIEGRMYIIENGRLFTWYVGEDKDKTKIDSLLTINGLLIKARELSLKSLMKIEATAIKSRPEGP